MKTLKPIIGVAPEFVRLIRKRAREELSIYSPFNSNEEVLVHKIGMKVERGEMPGNRKAKGTWIDVLYFVPDESCSYCNKSIAPGQETEADDGYTVYCPSCAERFAHDDRPKGLKKDQK